MPRDMLNSQDPYKPKTHDVRPPRDQGSVREQRAAPFDVPGARVEYVRDYKRRKRAALLDQLVPTRRCTKCGKVKVRTKQWVVVGQTAICRSCHMKGL